MLRAQGALFSPPVPSGPACGLVPVGQGAHCSFWTLFPLYHLMRLLWVCVLCTAREPWLTGALGMALLLSWPGSLGQVCT